MAVKPRLSLTKRIDEAVRQVQAEWMEETGRFPPFDAASKRELQRLEDELPERCTWARSASGHVYLVPGCEAGRLDPDECECDTLQRRLDEAGRRLHALRKQLDRTTRTSMTESTRRARLTRVLALALEKAGINDIRPGVVWAGYSLAQLQRHRQRIRARLERGALKPPTW